MYTQKSELLVLESSMTQIKRCNLTNSDILYSENCSQIFFFLNSKIKFTLR